MRYKYLLCLGVSFIITGFSACKCNRTPGNQGEQVYLYTFEKTAPLTQDNSKQMITDYLGIKDVHDLTFNKDENVVYFVSDEDVNTTFEQNLSNGNFEFSNLNKSYGELVPQLPSKDEAIKIAESFMKAKNISPKNMAELKLVHNGGVRAQSVLNGEKAWPIVDKLITLTYGRVVDSLPVIGAGSKIIINIGDKGQVVGMTRRWRELNPAEKKQLKAGEMFTKSEAEEQAKKQIQTEFGQVPYDIRSSAKSYYDGNGNYMQPVWAFDVMLNLSERDKNAKSVRYLCIIPMLKNSPEPLQLNVLDPRAKQIIKSVEPGRDTTRINRNANSD
jgi:hypothetical protein